MRKLGKKWEVNHCTSLNDASIASLREIVVIVSGKAAF